MSHVFSKFGEIAKDNFPNFENKSEINSSIYKDPHMRLLVYNKEGKIFLEKFYTHALQYRIS